MAPKLWLEYLLDVVLSPALWLGVVLALIYSVLFTAWRGGGWRQFGRDALAGLIGFGLGQLAGVLLGLQWARVGQLHLIPATLGAFLALMLGRQVRRLRSGQG